MIPYRNPDPVEDAEQRLRRHGDQLKMFTDPDGYISGLPGPERARVESWLSWSPDAEKDKRSMVARGYVGEFYGLGDEQLANGGYEVFRERFAREELGAPYAPDMDDSTFHGLLKAKVQKEEEELVQAKSFVDAGEAAALNVEPGDMVADLEKIQSTATNIDPANRDRYVGAYRAARAEAEQTVGPYRQTARKILSALEQETGKSEGAKGIDDALDLMLTVPEPVQRHIFRMLDSGTGGEDEKGAAQKTGEAISRGLVGQLRGFINTRARNGIEFYEKTLSKSEPIVYLKPNGEPNLQFTMMAGRGELGMDSVAGEPSRKATPQEAEQLRSENQQAKRRMDLASRLIAFAENAVDPVTSRNAFARAWYGAAGSVGAMAPVAAGFGGTVIAAGGYADMAYTDLRSKGVDIDTARAMSQTTGVVQAGLDRLQFGILKGVPGLKNLTVPRIAAASPLAGNKLAQTGAAAALIQAPEYAIEKIQDAAPVVTAYVAEKLGMTVPEAAGWRKEWESWEAWDPDTYTALLPLSLVGGGYQGINSALDARKEIESMLTDKTKIAAMGIEPTEAERIAALPAGQRRPAYEKAYASREVNAPAAVAARQEVAATVAAEKSAGQADVVAMADAGISIGRVTDETGAPAWKVTAADGAATVHTDFPEAMATARAAMDEGGIRKDDSFFNALDTFAETMNPDDIINVTNETGTLLSQAEDAQTRIEGAETDAGRAKASADLTSIWERANVHRRGAGQAELNPDMASEESRAGLENLQVLGKSETEFRDGVARAVLTIYNGGSAVDLLEERAEADAKAFVGQGRGALAGLAAGIRHIEHITGDKYLNGADTDATAVIEGWSDIVRLYATATRKGNKVTGAVRAGKAKEASDARAMRDRLRKAEGSDTTGIFEKLRAYFDAFRATMARAARLMKAKSDGKLAAEVEELINRSVGLDLLKAHEGAVIAEATAAAPAAEAEGDIDWGSTFSIRPADSLEAISSALQGLSVPPSQKLAAYQAAADSLAGMARAMQWNDSVGGKISGWAIDRERIAMRQKLLTEKLEAVEADFGDLSGAEMLSSAYNNPVVEALFGPPAKGSPFRKPRLKRRPSPDAGGTFEGIMRGAEWDGSHELPNWFFGGTLAPDNAAQELFEAGLISQPSPDAMWDALGRALRTRAASRQRLDDYGRRKREARAEATAEAAAWAAKEMADLPKRQKSNARADQLRFLSALDALLMPFPAEVRGKVGGFVKLASLTTNESRQNEILRRVGKLEIEMERFLKKEYTERMKALLERSKPVKGAPGEKMVGKLGPDVQKLMDAVGAAMKLSAVDTDAEVAKIDSRIASGELTPDAELLAARERELVTLAGDWKHADAARMAAALKAADDTFMGGFMDWKRKQLEKRERRAAMREELINATGTQGTGEERDARAEKDLGWRGKAKDFFLSLGSFEEVTSYVFGKDSAESRRLTDAERTAAYQYEDAVEDMGGRVQDFFTSLAGSRLAGEKLRFKLSQKAFKAGRKQLSEMEAIQALLMWAQPDGKRHMEGARDEDNQPASKWHYDQAWVDDVFSKLSPEGRAVMDFIRSAYGAEWDTLNPLYRERHGVDLPRNENYAPITVAPQQAKAGEMVDPVSGAVVTGSILTPGSLRTRSRTAVAEPEFRDALQTMLAHHKQMEHWKAYYDFAVEAQAVIGHRDVANAVKAVGGGQGKLVLSKWLDLFAQGGNRDAAAALAPNSFLMRMYGRAARMALVGRAGTLMIQTTQLGAAAAEMPAGAFVSRFGKLMSGKLGWGDAIRSEFVQRRISEAPPIVRQAMAGLDSDNPNAVKHATARMGALISGADGLFTAGTYAMVLDYQRGMAKQAGLEGAEADAYAHAEAARITERVAQPTRAGTRSLFENTSAGPLAKLGWAFASEARQKLSLAVWAARMAKEDPARAARVAFVVWGVGGLMAAFIRNAWRDIRDDDDEEWLDERNWNLPSLVASTIAGPLQGIPGLGEALQGVVSKLAGTYAPGGSLFDSLGRNVSAAGDLATLEFMDDKEPVEELMKDVEAVMMAAGLFNETAASAASLFHVVRDGVSALDSALP